MSIPAIEALAPVGSLPKVAEALPTPAIDQFGAR